MAKGDFVVSRTPELLEAACRVCALLDAFRLPKGNAGDSPVRVPDYDPDSYDYCDFIDQIRESGATPDDIVAISTLLWKLYDPEARKILTSLRNLSLGTEVERMLRDEPKLKKTEAREIVAGRHNVGLDTVRHAHEEVENARKARAKRKRLKKACAKRAK